MRVLELCFLFFFDINSIDTKKNFIMSNILNLSTACQLHVYFKAVKKCDWSTCCDDVSSRLHDRYPEMRLIYNYEELDSLGLSITMSSNKDGGFPKLNIDMISSDEMYESDGEDCDESHNALNSSYNLTHCRDYLNELYNFNLDCVENCSWPLFPSRYVYILNFAFGVNYKKTQSTKSLTTLLPSQQPVYFVWSNNVQIPVNFKWAHYYETCNDESLNLMLDRYDRRRFYSFVLKQFDYVKEAIKYIDDDDDNDCDDDDCDDYDSEIMDEDEADEYEYGDDGEVKREKYEYYNMSDVSDDAC